MFYYNGSVRERHGWWSWKGLKHTFWESEFYVAASLDDFLREREQLQTSSFRKIKIGTLKTWYVDVLIRKTKYRVMNEPLTQWYRFIDEQTPKNVKAKSLDEFVAGTYADCLIELVDTGIKLSSQEKDQWVKKKFKNGQLYDSASSYLVYAPLSLPQNVPIYKVWVSYFPDADFARVVEYADHDDIVVRKTNCEAARRPLIHIVPSFEPV